MFPTFSSFLDFSKHNPRKKKKKEKTFRLPKADFVRVCRRGGGPIPEQVADAIATETRQTVLD